MFTNDLHTSNNTKQTHFITGSTGFIGSSIVLELLMHTKDDIYCLVRRSKNKSAQQRFMDLMTDLIEKFNYQNLIAISDLQRCKIVEGDLFSSFDGIKNQVLVEVDHFWHVAASLNYDEKYKEDIYHTNITGSKTILELAFQLNTKKFNHFSTAYVVGKKTGEILETVVESSESNNIYEQSKLAAEKIILAENRFEIKIFRPSIVIGHSKTYFAFNFSGLYGFIRRLVQFKNIITKTNKQYLENNPIKLIMDEDVLVNVVPVDYVAKAAVKVGLSKTTQKVFHLTSKSVPKAIIVVDAIFKMVGAGKPVYSNSNNDFSDLDKEFNEKIDFYSSYLIGTKHFSKSNSDPLLQNDTSLVDCLNVTEILQYVTWYLKELGVKDLETI
jgi:thioester reductase-like protein